MEPVQAVLGVRLSRFGEVVEGHSAETDGHEGDEGARQEDGGGEGLALVELDELIGEHSGLGLVGGEEIEQHAEPEQAPGG